MCVFVGLCGFVFGGGVFWVVGGAEEVVARGWEHWWRGERCGIVCFWLGGEAPGATPLYSSAASDVYKGQVLLCEWVDNHMPRAGVRR